MFRIIAVSIVLALLTVEQSTLLCQVLCKPVEQPTSDCRAHQPALTTVADVSNCGGTNVSAITFVREEGPRQPRTADAFTTEVPRHQLPDDLGALYLDLYQPSSTDQARPIESSLRI